jgi:hypothetical protein
LLRKSDKFKAGLDRGPNFNDQTSNFRETSKFKRQPGFQRSSRFEVSSFDIRICFEFRVSDFEFTNTADANSKHEFEARSKEGQTSMIKNSKFRETSTFKVQPDFDQQSNCLEISSSEIRICFKFRISNLPFWRSNYLICRRTQQTAPPNKRIAQPVGSGTGWNTMKTGWYRPDLYTVPFPFESKVSIVPLP